MVSRLTQETAEKILEAGPEQTGPVLFLIGNSPPAALEAQVREAAKTLRGRARFCLSGVSTQIEKRLADMAGVDEDGPAVITLLEVHAGGGNYHSSQKFRLPMMKDGTTSTEKIIEFVTDYEKGKLKPYLRSEPDPSPEDAVPKGGVGILVGNSFTDAAQDEDKDVLVDFYAPWCGHCRKFEPQYKLLAKSLKHVLTLRITKLDATRNEVENMQIMGFPTIILFPAGKKPKKQVMYQGDRQPDHMMEWLKSHCTKKFDDKPPKVEVEEEDPVESGLLDPSEEDL